MLSASWRTAPRQFGIALGMPCFPRDRHAIAAEDVSGPYANDLCSPEGVTCSSACGRASIQRMRGGERRLSPLPFTNGGHMPPRNLARTFPCRRPLQPL